MAFDGVAKRGPFSALLLVASAMKQAASTLLWTFMISNINVKQNFVFYSKAF